MSIRKKHQDVTRRAILDALGDQIAESGTMDFSIQDVARRAGVTHRTVYNHFPTRQDLNDAFAAHVEAELEGTLAAPPDADLRIRELPDMLDRLFPLLQAHEARLRAYVMLMVASRGPAGVAAARTGRFEALLEAELGPLPPGAARAITAAIRMFASTTGWHLLTEHHGLSHANALRTAKWAVRVLLEAATRGDLPHLEHTDEPDHGC